MYINGFTWRPTSILWDHKMIYGTLSNPAAITWVIRLSGFTLTHERMLSLKQKENKPITKILWNSVFRFDFSLKSLSFNHHLWWKCLYYIWKLEVLWLMVSDFLNLLYITFYSERNGKKGKEKGMLSGSTISCYRNRIWEKLNTHLATNFDFLVDQEKWMHTSAHMRFCGYRIILYK